MIALRIMVGFGGKRDSGFYDLPALEKRNSGFCDFHPGRTRRKSRVGKVRAKTCLNFGVVFLVPKNSWCLNILFCLCKHPIFLYPSP